jgi:hypothetical protein
MALKELDRKYDHPDLVVCIFLKNVCRIAQGTGTGLRIYLPKNMAPMLQHA